MIQNFLVLFKTSFYYLLNIITVLIIAASIFLCYFKVKTGKSFKSLLSLYFDVILKSFVFTGLLLICVFILTKYISIIYVLLFFILLSSISILLKYIHFVKSKKMILVDGFIIMSNIYFSYLLIMHERFKINNYMILGLSLFCFFLYQQIKKID